MKKGLSVKDEHTKCSSTVLNSETLCRRITLGKRERACAWTSTRTARDITCNAAKGLTRGISTGPHYRSDSEETNNAKREVKQIEEKGQRRKKRKTWDKEGANLG